jgi:hypothetical protein
MKCKLLFQALTVLTGLFLLQPISKAAEDYGAAYTKTFGGTVEVFSEAGFGTAVWNFTFAGTAPGSGNWSLLEAGLNTINNTPDANGKPHSVVSMLTFYTRGSLIGEPSISTLTISTSSTGVQSMSLLITDYYSGATLFSSGAPAPVMTGTIGIYQ